MEITKQEVERIASLSMLYVSQEDVEMLKSNLEAILTHAKKLDELDTDGVEPTTYILKQRNVFREDEPKDGGDHDALLKNAPEVEDGAFSVPKGVE